jgi:hypothetical protein
MEKYRKQVKSTGWCMTCCTRHTIEEPCPGELTATGPERHGWRVNVETPWGMEAYGVLVGPSYELWRSRIITIPNVLWLAPGSRGSMKFVGVTSEIAEDNATNYIKYHCRSRGLQMRTDLTELHTSMIGGQDGAPDLLGNSQPPAIRKIRFLQVGFGVSQVTESGGTGNLSETGIYIITDCPMEEGTALNVNLDIGNQRVNLQGSVVWMRRQPHTGRTAGMGVYLQAPPQAYLNYVRSLA